MALKKGAKDAEQSGRVESPKDMSYDELVRRISNDTTPLEILPGMLPPTSSDMLREIAEGGRGDIRSLNKLEEVLASLSQGNN